MVNVHITNENGGKLQKKVNKEERSLLYWVIEEAYKVGVESALENENKNRQN